jgi:hypothetical protein
MVRLYERLDDWPSLVPILEFTESVPKTGLQLQGIDNVGVIRSVPTPEGSVLEPVAESEKSGKGVGWLAWRSKVMGYRDLAVTRPDARTALGFGGPRALTRASATEDDRAQ